MAARARRVSEMQVRFRSDVPEGEARECLLLICFWGQSCTLLASDGRRKRRRGEPAQPFPTCHLEALIPLGTEAIASLFFCALRGISRVALEISMIGIFGALPAAKSTDCVW